MGRSIRRERWISAAVVGSVLSALIVLPQQRAAAADVGMTVTPLVNGLNYPWDLTFAPDGTMIYTQRGGVLSVRLADGTTRALTADLGDLLVLGETGLMGVVADPDFSSNRQIYTCQGYQSGATRDVRVIKWRIDADFRAATRVGGPVVSGMRVSDNGWHSGCRLRFDNSKNLYVATGDATIGTAPQDVTSLNGKVLRVTTSGAPAPGNPFISSTNANTRLIFTYGHRNVQGLSLRPGTDEMWSVEQGTGRDDEVNRLVAGRNYGYNPVPGYNESVPMTDPSLPNAMSAVFTTGFPTLALSGGAWLSGAAWGRWNGTFMAAALKAQTVRVLTITGESTVGSVESVAELNGTYGRLRSPQMGPDGALYLTTSNGGGADRILRITPRAIPGDSRCQGNSADVASPIAAVTANGTTTAFVIGTNRAVYYRRADPGQSYGFIPGIVDYGPAAISRDGRRIDLFVVGFDGSLNYRSGVGTDWPGGWTNLGGILTSSPAAVSFSPGTMDVFGRGLDKALWTIRWDGSTWSGWTRVGGALTSAPGAAIDPDTGRAVVGVRGTDGRLWQAAGTGPGAFGGFVGPGIGLCSAPTYVTRAGDGDKATVVMVTADHSGEVVADGSVLAVGGYVQGSIAAVAAGSGYLLFGRGQNNELWAIDTRGVAGSWRSLGGQII